MTPERTESDRLHAQLTPYFSAAQLYFEVSRATMAEGRVIPIWNVRNVQLQDDGSHYDFLFWPETDQLRCSIELGGRFEMSPQNLRRLLELNWVAPSARCAVTNDTIVVTTDWPLDRTDGASIKQMVASCLHLIRQVNDRLERVS